MKKKIAAVCVLGALIFVFLAWHYVLPNMVTRARLEDAATIARAKNLLDGYTFPDKKDWWGNPIYIYSYLTADGTAYIYEAVAAGKDGVYKTADDMVCLKKDYNKSKIIGQYVGSKFKEAAKGFKEGLTKKNKFEK